jgi:hypothetical protein
MARHWGPCTRISPIQTWESVTAFLGKRTGVIGGGWFSPAGTNSCIGDAPAPSTASFNPRRFSNLSNQQRTPARPSPLPLSFHPYRSLPFCLLTSSSLVAPVVASSLTQPLPNSSLRLAPALSTPYHTRPRAKPRSAPSNRYLGRAHLTDFTDDHLGTYIASDCLRSPSFRHHYRGRKLSLVCLYAPIRLTPFTITAET